MDDALLFLHMLAAFCLVAGVVVYGAAALGAPPPGRGLLAAEALWGVGLIGTLILGIWLALRIDGYELTDAWILVAIVLWLVAGGVGDRARAAMQPADAGAGGATERAPAAASSAVALNAIRGALALLLLADMIFKPWA